MFFHYVARCMTWHFKGSLAEDEEIPNIWLVHPDDIIKAQAAAVVGVDKLTALSEAREAAGDLVGAAEASWAGSLIPGLRSVFLYLDLLFRSQDLLERANDSQAMAFEAEVVRKACYTEIGSPRQMKALQRRQAIRIAKPNAGAGAQ